MSESYYDADSSVLVKAGDILVLAIHSGELWNIKVTTVRILKSGLRRTRFVKLDQAPSRRGAPARRRGI